MRPIIKLVSGALIFIAMLALLAACQAAPPATMTPAAAVESADATPVPTVDLSAIQMAAREEAMAAMKQQEAENMALVQRFYDEFSAGRPEVILELHPETFTMHYAGSTEDVSAQTLYEDLAAIKAGNPDLHAEIHSMFAAGDYVFTELTWAGTHTGDLFGIPATGKPILHNGILVRRLADGKIVESWEIWDDLTLMNGLGFVPSWDEIVSQAAAGAEAEPTAESPETASAINPGLYYARLKANNPLGISSGYYALRLHDDGSYAMVWFGSNRDQMEAGESGFSGATGTYIVEGDQITFTDIEGPTACTEADGATGVYGFSMSGSSLHLSPINDACQTRVYVLSTLPLAHLKQ